MSISNIVSEDDTLLVSQVDAESANISGLINCVDLVAVDDVTCNKVIIAGESIEYAVDNAYVVGVDNAYFSTASVSGKVSFQKVGKVCSCVATFTADTQNIVISNQILSCSIAIPVEFQPATNFGDETIGTIQFSNQQVFFPASPQGTPIYGAGVATGERNAIESIICQFEYSQAANEILHLGINAMWNSD